MAAARSAGRSIAAQAALASGPLFDAKKGNNHDDVCVVVRPGSNGSRVASFTSPAFITPAKRTRHKQVGYMSGYYSGGRRRSLFRGERRTNSRV